MKLEEKIEKLIKKGVKEEGVILKKIEIKSREKAKELIITIDKKGGVSVEDCARVSRRIDPILEKADLFESKWYLIVSSPGI